MHMSFLLIHSANPLLRPHSRIPASLRPSTMLTEEWVTLSRAPIVLVWHSVTDLSHRPRSETGLCLELLPTKDLVLIRLVSHVQIPCQGRERAVQTDYGFFTSLSSLYPRPTVPLGPLVDKSVAKLDFLKSRKKKIPGLCHHTVVWVIYEQQDQRSSLIKVAKSIAELFTS